MEIVYSSSDAYAACTGISVYSLCQNNKDVDTINIYILSTDISLDNKARLKYTAKSFGRSLTIIDAAEDFCKIANQFNLQPVRGSYNCYSRIMLNHWFSHLDRVIVIDSDTMVWRSINDLWNLNLEGYYFGLVPEVAAYAKDFKAEDVNLVNGVDCYYNTGICIANLKQWRNDNASDYMIAKLIEESDTFKIADQSIINKYFNKKILRLPLGFNYYTPVHGVSYKTLNKIFVKKKVFTEEELDEARKTYSIIHYYGHSYERPWFKHSVALKKKEYRTIWDKSVWSDVSFGKWRQSGGIVIKWYDCICYLLLCCGFYNFSLKFRYIWGQRIKDITGIHR